LTVEEEEDAVARAKQRDLSAWAAWFEEHYRDLFRYAFAKTGSREDADDIASHTFLIALKSIDRYDYRGRPILAWLYGIARNLVSQKTRTEARSNRTKAVLSATNEAVEDTEWVLDRVDLLEAIRLLTPEQQDVIFLRFFLSKTTKETAQIMCKNENAVFALQFRAINTLRRRLMCEPEVSIGSSNDGR